MYRLPVSVIMLTLNVDYHLAEAIKNIKPWSSGIFILDSCSTDRTVDIALQHGVNIAQRRFTNFGDQWNFALEHFPVTTPWTMKLDPDERVTPKLMEEIGQAIQCPDSASGYDVPIRAWFMGKPLRPSIRVTRLWRTGQCKFSDVIVNEHMVIHGKIGHLKNFIEHHDSPDLTHWMDKQNRYTTMEAIMKTKRHDLPIPPKLFGNKLERRMFFKKHFNRIPFRYIIYWIYLMMIRGAWRDGVAGTHWTRLRVEVLRMIELKAQEMLRTGRIPEVPRAPSGGFDPRVLSSDLQQSVMLSAQWEKNG